MIGFPTYRQLDQKDCGPTCLRIVCKYYKKSIGIQTLREMCSTNRIGTTLLDLSHAAEKIGFRTLSARIDFDTVKDDVPLPLIAHWNNSHYIVVYKVKKNEVYVSDPAFGLLKYTKEEFIKNWTGSQNPDAEGVVLLLEPRPEFYKEEWEDDDKGRSFSYYYKYILKYKKFLVQLVVGLLAGSLLQLVFPFLTQSIVDIGVLGRDLSFIYIILVAQVFLFAGRTGIEIIRSWILLHLSTRINISLVTDFFIKLMNLPINYFDSRMTGDIMQRINDHNRIETFMTSSTLNVLFSVVNMIIFSAVLLFYSPSIFGVFAVGSTFYVIWIVFFLKKRKELDYKRFSQMSENQSKVIELINGMQEIKLHNAEKQKRWGWEHIQVRLFKISIKSLTLGQIQSIGSSLINELKNIFITFLSAKMVIDGNITLGMMMSISYITGQLNSPIMQLVSLIQTGQDAKISLDRLNEIHSKEEEDATLTVGAEFNTGLDISLDKVDFRYNGQNSPKVLDTISLTIPAKKITAIVGSSGSGKTTLMKLLLKFYDTESGEVNIGGVNLKDITNKEWRDQCGVVMQEGYIFNDTIAGNIAVGEEVVNKRKLQNAIEIANIKDYIDTLPKGIKTPIGQEGIGLSTGQKQRLLIARAVYKSPEILFFDEATSALDANNEKVIMENLERFMQGRTSVVIAHRLSTVKNADQIVVLEKGEIVELGNHAQLVEKKGFYFNLVKNQLELGD